MHAYSSAKGDNMRTITEGDAMSTKTDSQKIDEGLQRVTRLETRLMVLAAKLGFDLKDEDYIYVDAVNRNVHLKSMDVAFTSVIKAARRAGLHGGRVDVYCGDNLIGELPV
jgi:hypothetical protein